MEFLSDNIHEYIAKHTSQAPEYLNELERETWLKVLMPRMLSGHVQGHILKMFSTMMRPQYILEVGTYTGYASHFLVEGLATDGEFHAVEINEELETIIKKYGKNIKPADMEQINKVFGLETKGGKKVSLQNLNLKNPDHVSVLHNLVKSMGIKDNSLINMLAATSNPETLPNIMFDITAKELGDITDILPLLKKAGYLSKNIHLTWILTNYVIAMDNNKSRERMVPEDTLLKTHEGAANTVWGLVTSALPKGMDGRIDVVLNNPKWTVFYKDASGNTIEKDQDKVKTSVALDKKGKVKHTRTVETKATKFVAGFKSLPVKDAGGSIYPESEWKKRLYGWVKDNAPDSVTANM